MFDFKGFQSVHGTDVIPNVHVGVSQHRLEQRGWMWRRGKRGFRLHRELGSRFPAEVQIKLKKTQLGRYHTRLLS